MLNENIIILNESLYFDKDNKGTFWIEVAAMLGLETWKKKHLV